MVIAPGYVIAGKYKIDEQLGRGGMGAVWLAEHLLLGSPVAIKVIDCQGGSDDSTRRRFLQEAKAAAQLRSSHVVQIFDYGIDQDVPYIVMERLIGESMAARLLREQVLSPELAAKVFAQIGRAVQKAHDGGIIHRDLKPDNIFLVKEDDHISAKVLDFGIAKAFRKQERAQETTDTGVLLGSPLYMSPEQAHGGKDVDHRSDLWSLAVMAFECMVGRVPFRGLGWGELVVQICRDSPPVPSSVRPVPEGFDAWFAHAAERDPERRFQSCREMIQALTQVLVPTGGIVKFVSSIPPAPAATKGVSSADSTLDLHEQPDRTVKDPASEPTVASRLQSTTGAVASSDRPSARPARRAVFATVLLGALSVVLLLIWGGWSQSGPGGATSASGAPGPRDSGRPSEEEEARVRLEADAGGDSAPRGAATNSSSALPVPIESNQPKAPEASARPKSHVPPRDPLVSPKARPVRVHAEPVLGAPPSTGASPSATTQAPQVPQAPSSEILRSRE